MEKRVFGSRADFLFCVTCYYSYTAVSTPVHFFTMQDLWYRVSSARRRKLLYYRVIFNFTLLIHSTVLYDTNLVGKTPGTLKNLQQTRVVRGQVMLRITIPIHDMHWD